MIEKKDLRQICTKKNPMPPNAPGRWEHPDAEEIGEDYGPGGGVADGDYIDYKCPNCGIKFKEELPN
jgi:hypothetical protein